MKPDQERVKTLLTDTVTLLCKNGLTYNKELKVQGLLGITTDEDEVFIVHINEKFCEALGAAAVSIRRDDDADSQIELASAAFTSATSAKYGSNESGSSHRKKPGRIRARKRSRDSASPNITSPTASPSQQISHSHSRKMHPSYSDNTSYQQPSDTQSPYGYSPSISEDDSQATVKIKQEEDDDDVVIIDKKPCRENLLLRNSSHGEGDTSAMQQSYGGMALSLEEIQSGFPQFDPIDTGMECDNSPSKRLTSGSVARSSGHSLATDSDPQMSLSGPFITGIVHNVGKQLGLPEGQLPSTSMDNSSLGTITAGGQVMMEGAPGCSTWDPSQLQGATARSQGPGHAGETSESLLQSVARPKSLPDSYHNEEVDDRMRRPRQSKEKYQQCDHPGCGKTFFQRCNLLRHQTNVHGRRPLCYRPRGSSLARALQFRSVIGNRITQQYDSNSANDTF